MQIEIEGDSGGYNGQLSPSALRVKAYLDAIPEAQRGKVLRDGTLAERVGLRGGTINRLYLVLPDYTHCPTYIRGRPCRVWGHPDAIVELRKRGGVL